MGALWLVGCSAPNDDARQVWPEPSPAVWEITAPEGQKGWLFGTIHALPDEVEWRTPLIDHTLTQSGVLVVEVADLGDPTGPDLFNQLAHAPGQPLLTQRVAPVHRPALRALLNEAERQDEDFPDTESWAAALSLAAAVREGDPRNGVDRVLLSQTQDVVALESYDGQLAMFDTLSAEAQSALLAGVAEERKRNAGGVAVDAWLTGNDQWMVGQLNGPLLAHPELKAVLLTRRNAAWAQRIAALIEEGRAPFVAVGASHVVGVEGLADLLSQRGYDVQRLPDIE